jgi:hypothetical protein
MLTMTGKIRRMERSMGKWARENKEGLAEEYFFL